MENRLINACIIWGTLAALIIFGSVVLIANGQTPSEDTWNAFVLSFYCFLTAFMCLAGDKNV